MDPANSSAGAELDDASEWRTRALGGTEYSWLRAVPGGTGTTLLALRLSRGDAAEAALRSLRDAHPVLRARLRTSSPSGPTLAFPDPAPPFPLAPLPAPGSAPDFHALLEHELNRNPWADDAPVLFATLYELPAATGGVALFVRIHTVACDRSAASALARELVALLAGDGGEEPDPEDAAAEAGLEARIPQRDTWKPFWARGLDMVGYSINGLRTSTLPFVETGTERSTQMLRLGLGLDETTRLLDVSSSLDCSYSCACECFALEMAKDKAWLIVLCLGVQGERGEAVLRRGRRDDARRAAVEAAGERPAGDVLCRDPYQLPQVS